MICQNDVVTVADLRLLHTYHLQCIIELDDQIRHCQMLCEDHGRVLDQIDDVLEDIIGEP